MQQNANSEKITAGAYNRALHVVRQAYPDMPPERLQIQATRLAAAWTKTNNQKHKQI